MKSYFILLLSALLFCDSVDAQERVIDATDNSPISAASIFDAAGNLVGYTWNDGAFSEIPASAYPITLRCIGYEQLVIERPENKTWGMTPIAYELKEVVVVPIKRKVLKQTFYVREYFSMNNDCDTMTFFMEHMADRFVPATKDAKFGGNSSLRILNSHHYSRFQLSGGDSIVANPDEPFPSMLNIFKLNDEEVTAPDSFKKSGNAIKFHKESGKSGMKLIQKQNDHTFTMEFNQFYTTHAYRVNDKGAYLPKDLMEASSVIQADGRGKHLRKVLNSDKPIVIRSLIELYIVDSNYLSSEEAKEEYKNKPTGVKFVVPSSVPPLNEATRRLVERADAEAKTKK